MAIEFKGFTLDVDSLGKEALTYLLTYGFKQSLQDSVAGVRKAALDEGKSESEADEAVEAAMKARYDAILSGKVAVRAQGPRLQGLDKFVAEVADELLRAQCAKKGVKWPSGKGSADVVKGWRERLLASPMADNVKKEGKKRFDAYMAAQKAELDFDFDLEGDGEAEAEAEA